jgi:hypothetical protein
MNEELSADTNKIEIITRQTNYTMEEAREKLVENNNDHEKVIKLFLGIKDKVNAPIKSINQEIYRQLRYKMDASMREYNNKKV